MDFAPYQSSPPEQVRVASPQHGASPRASQDIRRPFSPVRNSPPLQHPQPQRAWNGFDGNGGGYQDSGSGGGGNHVPGAYPAEVSEFDTSLGLRLDYEAALAYIALPPLGPVILLILEKNSDYVRFHAWQSALVFTTAMVVHLIFSWSSFLSWFFFLADIVVIALLALRAYRDAEILDRFEVPFFGSIASRILDDE